MAAVASEGWEALLESFEPASEHLIADRALLCRTDVKFVTTPPLALAVAARLAETCAVLSAGEALVASYRTVYFDTDDLACYHDHRRGRRLRQKIRVRHYEGRRLSMLEVKSSSRDVGTDKLRRSHGYGDDELSAEERGFLQQRLGCRGTLEPRVSIVMRRVTLVSRERPERLTIDLDIGFAGLAAGRFVLRNMAILELKQARPDPRSPSLQVVRELGVRAGWASKYCIGVALTRPGVRRGLLADRLRRFKEAAEWVS